jgi:hypothetical protein
MNLFDQSISKYVISWKSIPLPNNKAELLDNNGKLVGYIKYVDPWYSDNPNTLTTLEEHPVLFCKKKGVFSRKYHILDEGHKQIGVVNRGKNKNEICFSMKTSEERELLATNHYQIKKQDQYLSGFEKPDFEINQPDGKNVARVSLEGRQFNVEIFDVNFDRKTLVGFLFMIFISAYNSLPTDFC